MKFFDIDLTDARSAGRTDEAAAIREATRLLKLHKERITPSTKCAVCDRTGKLVLSECCGLPMCVEPRRGRYRSRSCYEGHSRYTLCSSHYAEGDRGGNWKTCSKCRQRFLTEMYVWYGTNGYNVEKLSESPEYEPTKCVKCGKVIILSKDGYGTEKGKHICVGCITWK